MKPTSWKPGASPFRLNGVFYIGLRRYCQQCLPDGVETLVAAVAPELGAFFRGPFLATSLYDLLPLVPLTEALARLRKKPFADFLRARAHAQALSDCEGVYKSLVGRSGTERELLDGVVRASGRIYDFGRMEHTLVRPGLAEIIRHEVPDPALLWYQISTAEYVAAVLENAGWRGVKVVCQRKEPMHEVGGCRVWRVDFRVEWQVH